jgi:predicted nucleotidyltransferase
MSPETAEFETALQGLRPNRGPFASEEKALQAVLDRLAKALRPFRIYLFGSRAEGRSRPDSDFDLVVVFDDQAPNRDADYDEE